MILLRRAAVIVSLAALCASPALARRVGNTQSSEDNAARSQPHAPATPVAETIAPRANVPGNVNPDEPPTCLPAPSARNAAARTEVGRTNTPEPTRQPIAPEQSQERREKAKQSISPSTRLAPRQAPHKQSRVGSRPIPATPGMGALIRMGMTVGREISFLDDMAPSRPDRPHVGRAPPAPRSVVSAQASPAAPQFAANRHLPAFAPSAAHSRPSPSSRTPVAAVTCCPALVFDLLPVPATLEGFVS